MSRLFYVLLSVACLQSMAIRDLIAGQEAASICTSNLKLLAVDLSEYYVLLVDAETG